MHNIWRLIERYGCWGILRLSLDVVHTVFFFPGARLVRRPVFVRGKSKIRWGKRFTTGVGVRLDVFTDDTTPCLCFGNDVQLNDHVHISAIKDIQIGHHVLIGSRVFISDHNHGNYRGADAGSVPSIPPQQRPLVAKPVRIGDRVWIGEHVSILPGVTIGEGAIVGAGSVVTHDVPVNSIVAGNPARVIRVFDVASGTWQRG